MEESLTTQSMKTIVTKNGIQHQFSAPRIPQQNGVAERKNRSLQDMARTMLKDKGLPFYFWAEVVNSACYIGNRVFLRSMLHKTAYELWYGKKPNISYFRAFGCKCYILNTNDNIGKFDSRSDIGIFLGYSSSSRAYRVFNKRTLVVEESANVTFDEIGEENHGMHNIDNDDDIFPTVMHDNNNNK